MLKDGRFGTNRLILKVPETLGPYAVTIYSSNQAITGIEKDEHERSQKGKGSADLEPPKSFYVGFRFFFYHVFSRV